MGPRFRSEVHWRLPDEGNDGTSGRVVHRWRTISKKVLRARTTLSGCSIVWRMCRSTPSHSILPRCAWTTTIRSCGITRRTRAYVHCESLPPEWDT